MDLILGILAVLGGLALLLRLFRAAAGTLLFSAEAMAAEGLAETSARRGDLSALAERRTAQRTARHSRRRYALLFVLWLVLLLLPLLLGRIRDLYAAASLLWLLPSLPIRSRSSR